MSYCQIFDKVAQFRSLGTNWSDFHRCYGLTLEKKSKKLQNFQGLFI